MNKREKSRPAKTVSLKTTCFFVISGILILFSILVSVLFLSSIQKYSVDETYTTLYESQQMSLLYYAPTEGKRINRHINSEGIVSSVFSEQYSVVDNNLYIIPEILIVSDFPIETKFGLKTYVEAVLKDTRTYSDHIAIAGTASVMPSERDTGFTDKKPEAVEHDTLEIIVKDVYSEELLTVLDQIEFEIGQQKRKSQSYSKRIDEQTLYYLITKSEEAGRHFCVISFLWDTYTQKLFKSIAAVFGLTVVFSVVFGLIVAAFAAAWITKPVKQLEMKAEEISKGKWEDPVKIKSHNEIGRLAESMEEMRENLMKRDESRQAFLQYVSHELKTPIMTAKSYTEAIRDEIYPKGTLESSLEVIDEQFTTIEKRVNDLLNLTKSEYISEKRDHFKNEGFTDFIRRLIHQNEKQYPEFDWSIHIEEIKTPFAYEEELFKVMLENIISNQIRYARKRITFVQKAYPDHFDLLFENDGPQIDAADLTHIFDPFYKGGKGINGLGLNIVQRIVAAHDGKIRTENLATGVRFTLSFWGK